MTICQSFVSRRLARLICALFISGVSFSFAAWLAPRARHSFALNLTYAAVKPPNFIFLKAVNAAKKCFVAAFCSKLKLKF